MDIQKLVYFNCAAYYLNFTKAASVCNITQVAMSRAIAQIENELGFKLFMRIGKKVVLTPEGEAFHYDSNAILNHYNQAVNNARNISKQSKRSITIGYGEFDKVIALKYCKAVKNHFQNITINMYRADYYQIYSLLTSNVCDIFFAPESRLQLIKELRTIPVYHSNFTCLVSNENPLSKRKSITVNDLSNHSIIYPENLGRLEEQMRLKYGSIIGLESKSEYLYASSTESLLAMVRLNQGISAVPDQVYLDKPNDTTLIPIISKKNKPRVHSAACLNESKHNHISDVMNYIFSINKEIENDIHEEIKRIKGR